MTVADLLRMLAMEHGRNGGQGPILRTLQRIPTFFGVFATGAAEQQGVRRAGERGLNGLVEGEESLTERRVVQNQVSE